ncbi:YgfZ/GcvT domain-containing protein [Mesorhizobium sp. ZC-5]|uniref:CAF17-like 4Fe-4S cluster assembly/insertion protein YgfZ n=1 Tax=Mesorhizobium sp. ZC-5 TaxID=2986066 RepID=UPI0021E8D3A6|nr:folate-binding protein YgfZ [Mesorhizobium sp. ZC-5]MCV3240117.1 folate-binding protein YgfZ [Mesorhizobium sp. ZC-5]
MTTVHLANRTIVSVSGPDAEHFLQNILTTDLDKLAAGVAKPGALLTPQGKILFDFLISRRGADGFLLDCRTDVADDFVRRIMLYKLRAKVEITKRDQQLVSVSWETDSGASHSDSTRSLSETGLRDLRFPQSNAVYRSCDTALPGTGTEADWAALRVAHGIAESGSDYALGDAFPHDVLLDQMDGVGFKKGCYVGQEVVSRMQHRGTARRRILIVAAEQDLPPAGTDITAGGRSVGTLGTVVGTGGLAIARIDRVKDAVDSGTPLLAGDVGVTLSIPSWAKFSFPQDAANAADA